MTPTPICTDPLQCLLWESFATHSITYAVVCIAIVLGVIYLFRR